MTAGTHHVRRILEHARVSSRRMRVLMLASHNDDMHHDPRTSLAAAYKVRRRRSNSVHELLVYPGLVRSQI